jgi:hypothetical protein
VNMATSQGPVLVAKETRSALEEALSLARDPQPSRGSSGSPVGIVAEEARHASWEASKLEIPVTELRRLAKINHSAGTQPPIGRRVLRALIGFIIAASIGVGATVTWQHHGDEANKVIQDWAVASLDWVSSVSAKRTPAHLDAAAEQILSSADNTQVPAREAALAQTAPVREIAPSPISAQVPPELVQQLETAAGNLAALQQSIAELAAKQEQIFLDIAQLQAADREIRQKIVTARKKVPTVSQQPAAQTPSAQTVQPTQPPSTQTSSEIRPAPLPRPPSPLRD